VENRETSMSHLEKQEITLLLEGCYLRLKRILANEYVKNRSQKVVSQLKELKNNYEVGLKTIEKWI